MKRFGLFFLALTFLSTSTWAKKVRFSVDMASEVISALGVHVMGDFQDEAGFVNGDWQPNTALMSPNSDSTIFSIVVDIPAFRKYEYRFLNGDQSYNTEFIPNPSRVGYDFIDNRWIYIDSLADDTTEIGAIVFGGNAPRGLNLMRFLVQMPTSISVAAEGVHLIGDFQDWNLNTTYMYSFIPNIYEVIAYDSLGEHQYRFVNGETMEGLEQGIDSCFMGNVRTLNLSTDSVLTSVCFDACTQECTSPTGVFVYEEKYGDIYPNPSFGSFHLNSNYLTNGTISIWNMQGQKVLSERVSAQVFEGDFSNWSTGQYIVQIQDELGNVKQIKKWNLVR